MKNKIIALSIVGLIFAVVLAKSNSFMPHWLTSKHPVLIRNSQDALLLRIDDRTEIKKLLQCLNKGKRIGDIYSLETEYSHVIELDTRIHYDKTLGCFMVLSLEEHPIYLLKGNDKALLDSFLSVISKRADPTEPNQSLEPMRLVAGVFSQDIFGNLNSEPRMAHL